MSIQGSVPVGQDSSTRLGAVCSTASATHAIEETAILASLRAPAQARQFIEHSLCRDHARHALSAVVLAASEMTTQAVRYGDGALTMALICQHSTVTLAVTYATDSTVEDKRVRMADDVSARIIDAISRASGNDIVAGRQRMWCTIPTSFVPVPTISARRAKS